MRRRAANAGMSLQEYLLAKLASDAATPTLDELLDQAGSRSGGTAPLAEAVDAVRAERDTH